MIVFFLFFLPLSFCFDSRMLEQRITVCVVAGGGDPIPGPS